MSELHWILGVPVDVGNGATSERESKSDDLRDEISRNKCLPPIHSQSPSGRSSVLPLIVLLRQGPPGCRSCVILTHAALVYAAE